MHRRRFLKLAASVAALVRAWPSPLASAVSQSPCGDIQCEVSAQLWKQPGYDPLAAMQTCYRNMAAAFEKAAIPRPY